MKLMLKVFGKSKKDRQIECLKAQLQSSREEMQSLETKLQESQEQVELYEKYSKAMNDSHKDELDCLRREFKVVEEQKANLMKRLESLEGTEEAPKTRSSSPLFDLPSEGFQGEVHDHILIAIKNYLKTLDARCRNVRHRELLQAFLEKNQSSGRLSCCAKTVRMLLSKTDGKVPREVFRKMEEFGIRLIDGSNHWKVAYLNLTCSMPKTPSDIRSMKNCAADLIHCFFY